MLLALTVAVGVLTCIQALPVRAQTGEGEQGFWQKVPGPARYYHTATLLPTGKVLVAGGCEPAPPGPAACTAASDKVAIFDPATVTWSTAARMTTPRTGHIATVLPNGDVLVLGGCSGITPAGICDFTQQTNTAERYDVRAGTWTRVGGFETMFLAVFRSYSATLQPVGPASFCGTACGKVLVVGFVNSVLWDPGTATSVAVAERATRHGSLMLPLLNHSAVQLPSGRVVVMSADLTSAYDLVADAWAAGAKPSGRDHFSVSLLTPNQLLVTGGVQGDGSPSPFPEVYETETGDDPSAMGRWRPVERPAVTRSGHAAAALRDGEVLIAGGRDAHRNAVSAAEVYHAGSNRWRPAGVMTRPRGGTLMPTTSPMFHAASLTATVLEDGRVLAVGGDAEESADLYGPLRTAPADAAATAGPGRQVRWWVLGLVPAAMIAVVLLRWRTKSREARRSAG